MNPFTRLVWGVITDSPEFLEQLSAIMMREYRPFLAGEQAFRVNTKMLEGYVREELDKWHDWLAETSINQIGGGLAVEMLEWVDWDQVAQLVQQRLLQTRLTSLAVPNPNKKA